MVLEIANDSRTHWRYAIVAVRCLRALIRRDAPLKSAHVEYLLGKTHDSNASMVRPACLTWYSLLTIRAALRKRITVDLSYGREPNTIIVCSKRYHEGLSLREIAVTGPWTCRRRAGAEPQSSPPEDSRA